MGFRLSALLGALLILSTSMVQAEIVRDLYVAVVPVTDHSDSALAAASGQALSQVVVKASGSEEVLENPVIAQSMGRARSLVQQYSYTEVGVPPELGVRVEFTDRAIAELLTAAGAPLWTANRPVVLAWIVVEDQSGRRFLNWDNDPELAPLLLEQFAMRGVPVQLPLFDLQDSAALSTDAVWYLTSAPVQSASLRYNRQSILMGRVAVLSNGEWVGDWSFLSSAGRADRSVSVFSASDYLQQGVAFVAEDMAARFAVAPSAAPVGGILMEVGGVTSYGDYAGIVSWLEGLELIDQADIERISGDTVALRLSAQANADQLGGIIELNPRLIPRPGALPSIQLNYLWQN